MICKQDYNKIQNSYTMFIDDCIKRNISIRVVLFEKSPFFVIAKNFDNVKNDDDDIHYVKKCISIDELLLPAGYNSMAELQYIINNNMIFNFYIVVDDLNPGLLLCRSEYVKLYY